MNAYFYRDTTIRLKQVPHMMISALLRTPASQMESAYEETFCIIGYLTSVSRINKRQWGFHLVYIRRFTFALVSFQT